MLKKNRLYDINMYPHNIKYNQSGKGLISYINKKLFKSRPRNINNFIKKMNIKKLIILKFVEHLYQK